jgi:hypothetical protein
MSTEEIKALEKGLEFFNQLKEKDMTTFTSEDRVAAERKKEQWEIAYDDWKQLLETANAKELLQDPSACFDEGWRQASMITIATVLQFLSNTNPDLIRTLEKRLLK